MRSRQGSPVRRCVKASYLGVAHQVLGRGRLTSPLGPAVKRPLLQNVSAGVKQVASARTSEKLPNDAAHRIQVEPLIGFSAYTHNILLCFYVRRNLSAFTLCYAIDFECNGERAPGAVHRIIIASVENHWFARLKMLCEHSELMTGELLKTVPQGQVA